MVSHSLFFRRFSCSLPTRNSKFFHTTQKFEILTDNGKLKFESFIGVSTDLVSVNAFNVIPGPVIRVGT